MGGLGWGSHCTHDCTLSHTVTHVLMGGSDLIAIVAQDRIMTLLVVRTSMQMFSLF